MCNVCQTPEAASKPACPMPPRSRAPSLCPATVSLTARASFNGICDRQQPPPTALTTPTNRMSNGFWGRLRDPCRDEHPAAICCGACMTFSVWCMGVSPCVPPTAVFCHSHPQRARGPGRSQVRCSPAEPLGREYPSHYQCLPVCPVQCTAVSAFLGGVSDVLCYGTASPAA